ncbi:OmpA family protein [Chitinophaga oryziterrae]|uniref:OmpA family protein n=1 Tax=Chitinophaga oryziterrae TaxID=1031224 RepID=A0A6N8JDR4_9BACT|nr:OmpA family protein [Chitinophaga oryziterrae]MVT43417.1 OmpA family protein [Chitinophaga oryziterrae]
MNTSKSDAFWPSYTDLMTSLFFIMLVLYILTYVRLNSTIQLQANKLKIIETVEENLRPLKTETSLFIYEEQYRRFKLAFDVKFGNNQYQLTPDQLYNYQGTIERIDKAGLKLKSIIDHLEQERVSDERLKRVSYVVVIAGYASKSGEELHNYELSYKRALELKNYWKSKGIDFEAKEYEELVDLQIAGNGWGGIGRLPLEVDNQRFLIQIFPKIGDVK